jgi:hypothetical protein
MKRIADRINLARVTLAAAGASSLPASGGI